MNSHFSKIVTLTCYGALILFIFLFFLRPIETGDIWWHLSTARHIFETQAIPDKDPFPFNDKPASLTYTQWLGGCVYYLVYSLGEVSGLSLFRSIIFLLVFTLFYFYARRKVPDEILLPLIFIMCFGLGLRAHIRPYLFNYIFIQLFLIVLYAHQEGRDKYLWTIPVMGIVWSNLHLGSFVYGVILLGVFLFSYFLKCLVTKFECDSFKKFKSLLLMSALYLVSFMVSPYGIDGLVYPIKVFFIPEYIYFYKIGSNEMVPPVFLLSVQGAWFFILVFITTLFLGRSRPKYVTNILLFGVALLFLFYGQRGIAFFVLIFGYLCVSSYKTEYSLPKILKQSLLPALIVILSLNIIRTVNKHSYYEGESTRRVATKVDRLNPNKNLSIFLENEIYGNVYNSSIYGGYMYFNYYPRLNPFIDTRQIDLERSTEYIHLIGDFDHYWESLQEKYQFTIALFNMKEEYNINIVRGLTALDDWKLVGIDGFNIMFVKRDFYRNLPKRLNLYEKRLKNADFDVNSMKERIKDLAFVDTSLIKDFLAPPYYFVDTIEEALTLYDIGYKKNAMNILLKTYEETKSAKALYALKMMVEDE